jgi:uncharacterized protein
MVNSLPLPRVLCLVAATVLLAGCASSQAARFYTLTPVSVQKDRKPGGQTNNQVSVSIAQVEIPDYLDRPQIVTQEGGNELKLAEFDRWAGSLSVNISAVLAENLASLLGSDLVFVSPRMNSGKADFGVSLRVLRLDLAPGDRVLLKVQWSVFAGQKKSAIATHLATFTERVTGSNYEVIAAAVSQTIAQISREIAKEIAGAEAGAKANAAGVPALNPQ